LDRSVSSQYNKIKYFKYSYIREKRFGILKQYGNRWPIANEPFVQSSPEGVRLVELLRVDHCVTAPSSFARTSTVYCCLRQLAVSLFSSLEI